MGEGAEAWPVSTLFGLDHREVVVGTHGGTHTFEGIPGVGRPSSSSMPATCARPSRKTTRSAIDGRSEPSIDRCHSYPDYEAFLCRDREPMC